MQHQFTTVRDIMAELAKHDPDTIVAVVDHNYGNDGGWSGPSGPGCNFSGCSGSFYAPVELSKQRGWSSYLERQSEHTPTESREVLVFTRDHDRRRYLIPQHRH